MPELLLELFSEEIPARMQQKAAEDLRALITNGLVEAGLTYEGAQTHAGPRRLVLSVEGLNAKAADVAEERKGPRVDAPQTAIDGFLKSTGLKLDDLKVQDDKKGKLYIAVVRKAGQSAPDVIAALVPDVIRKFPWPKSMRWGSGTLRWVRPLQSILCTFDGEVVPFAVEGIASGNVTRGHRFMGVQKIEVRRFEDYAAKLHKQFVVVDSAARAETIRTEARNLAFAQGLEVIEDEGLLKETAGLAEWPVVLMGEFDAKFLAMPPEVIATTIKNHQKCFALRDTKSGKLSNKYILVANLAASDGGKQVVAGNNKVVAARLSDAQFFWDHDRKTPLEKLLPRLDTITFHAKLGSQGERVKRIEALAGEIAKTIGADIKKTQLAAKLSKADLVTGMVGEFPELQGLMGRYYALDQGIDPEVADAIRDHYKPQGPSDSIPVSKVGQAVALADKLDTLVGFWAVDEKPTGSKDPYALRRAALGIVRSVLEENLRLRLGTLIETSANQILERQVQDMFADSQRAISQTADFLARPELTEEFESNRRVIEGEFHHVVHGILRIQSELLSFFGERLRILLREQGKRHDLVDAVFSIKPITKVMAQAMGGGSAYADVNKADDLLMVFKRVEALSKFLETDDGKNLLTGVKRAANILKIEEKKDGHSYGGDVRPDFLIKGEEKALHSAITVAAGQARKAIEHEDFEAAMRAIARLRAPVDAFFDSVTVNDKDATFRENRLKLLNRIRAATLEVADFSKIEG